MVYSVTNYEVYNERAEVWADYGGIPDAEMLPCEPESGYLVFIGDEAHWNGQRWSQIYHKPYSNGQRIAVVLMDPRPSGNWMAAFVEAALST